MVFQWKISFTVTSLSNFVRDGDAWMATPKLPWQERHDSFTFEGNAETRDKCEVSELAASLLSASIRKSPPAGSEIFEPPERSS